ncbi:MAG TPA: prepilin peptidase [Thermoleophilaceae bacterium]|nr:prepilin peptidase [Thermoleophilaceae bacterium]
MAIVVVFAGVFGAIIGSFLTVVAHRVPARESIVSPGSACPSCGHELRWRENVPIVSWLVQRGRCANCGAAIGARYPALEGATAVAFALVTAVHGLDPYLALALPLAAVLIVVAVIDFEQQVVPNPIVLVAAVYALPAWAVVDPGMLPEVAIAGAGAFLAFLLMALAYPAGMGMGDVKLAGVMGLYLGLDVVPAFLVAFLTGSVVGIVLIARGGAGERRRGVPFAPFLALGGIVALLVGPELIDLYADRFL